MCRRKASVLSLQLAKLGHAPLLPAPPLAGAMLRLPPFLPPFLPPSAFPSSYLSPCPPCMPPPTPTLGPLQEELQPQGLDGQCGALADRV